MSKTKAGKKLVYEEFYNIHQFPEVIGSIYCTHIRIQSPIKNIRLSFRSRKATFQSTFKLWDSN